ncbi:MAG: hypothetical protein BWK76_13110 [Desulfobulbaceae bacterium A2]|nr:MAG: hypothetical protein BWK76_13110 [Desulfobulbaceae bacterium A2]
MPLPATPAAAPNEQRTYRKVSLRLIPLLFSCYIVAYLDRVNIGFARLQMSADLGFSEVVYGTGAGIFFLGYFLFEVPSNIVLSRVGARLWIARIMVMWGLISAGMMFVTSASGLYTLRFLLGVAEAGFFPGIILYLTYWFPRQYRARMVAWFMTAVPLAGVLGGPVSGWILSALQSRAGYAGWQWLFLTEGLMPVVLGVWVFFHLDDSPAKASWLSPAERTLLLDRLREEEPRLSPAPHLGTGACDGLKTPRVWLLATIYFCMVMGLYGISFWLPQIIKESLTEDTIRIGLLSAIPWTMAAVVMVLYGAHSDRTGERRRHVTLACLTAAGAFTVSALPGMDGWSGFLALTVATAGIMAALSCFWTLPMGLLRGSAAATGIAWINSLGNLAGYVSPELVGLLREYTAHSMAPALALMAVSLLLAGLLTLAASGSPERCSKKAQKTTS